MCFSATASFLASSSLALISSKTITLVKRKSAYPLAHIPTLFAIQQAFEGFVWLSFSQNSFFIMLQPFAGYAYLFFALIFWPLWIPLSCYLLEKKPKKIMWLFLFSLPAVALASFLITALPCGMTVSIACFNIVYKFTSWENNLSYYVYSASYLLATTLPLLLSSHRFMWLLGTTLAIFYAISYYYYYHAFLSVWCFFAALLSMQIYFITKANKGFERT